MQQVNLLSAFKKKSSRVKKQAMLDVSTGDFKINQIVLLSPQLLTDAILGGIRSPGRLQCSD
jgi:hypothetical protein